MTSTLTFLILLTALVAVVLIARGVRRFLPDHHLSADSRDAVKLAMGLVATMTALLLGLLVSSAKGTYDTQRGEVVSMAAKVTFLDRVLLAYGPETVGIRNEFRAAVADAVRRMWPDESDARAVISSKAAIGDTFYLAILRLSPENETQRALKSQAATLGLELGQLRALLVAQMVPSIPRPLLHVVMIWLGVLFLGFSLLAPPNALTTFSLVAAAMSVAAAVFLILEMDQPLSGVIRLSSQPLRHALEDISR